MNDAINSELERNRDVERFILFTDAVVAIAITLLVLPLVDVATEAADTSESVATILADNSSHFLSFAISFVVIAGLWLGQQRMFDTVVKLNAGVVRASLAWILAIVMIPFTTELIALREDSQLARILYVATILLASASMTLLGWERLRDDSMSTSSPAADRAIAMRSGINTALAALTLGAAIVFPGLGMWVMLLMALFPVVLRLMTRR